MIKRKIFSISPVLDVMECSRVDLQGKELTNSTKTDNEISGLEPC
jgi:hypothetical protein